MKKYNDDILVRSWTKRDLSNIQKLVLKSWLETYNSIFTEGDIRLGHRKNYNKVMLNKYYVEKIGFVALTDEQIVAYLIAQNQKEFSRFYINSLYVLKEYQNRGIGKKLLKTAYQEALKMKYDKVWLDVFTENTKAYDWYMKHKFMFIEKDKYEMGTANTETNIGYRII